MTTTRLEPLTFETLFDFQSHRDAEGRALGEHRASEAVCAEMPMVLKQCPYAGSRFQHKNPMNVSALKQLTNHWDDILTGISFVRTHYLQRRGLQSVQRDEDCLAIGEAIASLPSYLIYRAERAIQDGAIDPRVGGMFKVIIGVNRVYAILISMPMMMSTARSKPNLSSPEEIEQWTDFGGFLIGGEQVCAGSGRQIGQTIGALLDGGPASAPTGWAVQALLDPVDRFFSFADGMRRLEAGKFLVRAAATLALLELAACLDRAAANDLSQLRSNIGALITKLDAPGTIQNFASTRTPDQLDRLLCGWFGLAGGTSGGRIHKPNDASSRAWTARFSKALGEVASYRIHPEALLKALGEPLYMLLHLERRMLPVLDETERQLNAALGRNTPEASGNARRVSRCFGVTMLDQLGAELGVDLDRLS